MPPLIVAHRGASRDAPENTLAAFQLAWRQGADGIEGDFHLTADKQIVCIHDSDMRRTAGQPLTVCEQPLAALRQLDVGSWHSEPYRGERIPTLAEVLATAPAKKRIEIEVKCGTEIIAPLLAVLKKAPVAAEQLVFLSFQAEVIAALKTQLAAAGFNCRAHWLIDAAETAARSASAILHTLKQCNADGIGSCPTISRQTAEQLLAAGYDWHVWTVDAPPVAKRLLQWGASSITTNVPAVLRNALSTDKIC